MSAPPIAPLPYATEEGPERRSIDLIKKGLIVDELWTCPLL